MTKKQKIVGNRSARWALIAIVVILSLLSGWFVTKYYWLQPRQYKEQFSKLERMLDEASREIAADSKRITKERGCSRPQEKYGPGALTCSIRIQIPNEDVQLGTNAVWNVFDSIGSFQKQGSGQDEFRQYSYEDISCSVEISSMYHSIACGRTVTRAIY